MITRRHFVRDATAFASLSLRGFAAPRVSKPHSIHADIVIIGGGTGGFAAALGAARNGCSVILTEETDWIGGQFTAQGLSVPDESAHIEQFGRTLSYAQYRSMVRAYYRDHYTLTPDARSRANLNPGDGWVSALCHEPRVALAVMYEMLMPYLSSGQLTLLLKHKATAADVTDTRVRSVLVQSADGDDTELTGTIFLDATELGDLLPLTRTEYVTGQEAQSETHELHAPAKAAPNSVQCITYCYAVDYRAGEDHTIEEPAEYRFWRDYVPDLKPAWTGKLLSLIPSSPYGLGPRPFILDPSLDPPDRQHYVGGAGGLGSVNLLGHREMQQPLSGDRKVEDLWTYRRIRNRHNFVGEGPEDSVTIVNWPQNDYWLGRVFDVPPNEAARHLASAKQLSLSLLYWMQTEAPRPDGKAGWPGIRLRPDVVGTEDGLAKYPYIRESRRIRALFTVTEAHVGTQQRMQITGKSMSDVTAAPFFDTVGIGSYRLDAHPTTAGVNYLDLASLPHEIPLGALIPQRMENLLAAAKNTGTTHISNTCYREHPIEWNIGEAAGALAAFCIQKRIIPRQVRETPGFLSAYQFLLAQQGVELHWPRI